jgi:hypothetical protein
MRLLRRFLSLNSPDRALLAESFFYLSVTRIGLWIVPFRRLCRGSSVHPVRRREPERLVRAVHAASRLVPKSTCLVRAIAAERLIATYGHSSVVRIGVAKSATSEFEAHAWLECRGSIILGDMPGKHYVALPIAQRSVA